MATKIIKFKDENTTYLPVTDAKVVQYDNSGTKISVQTAIENLDENKLDHIIYWGECNSAGTAYRKIITGTGLPDDPSSWKIGTIIGVKYTYTDTKNKASSAVRLNINDTDASNDKPIYYNTGVLSTAAAQTVALGTANRYTFYMWDGTNWVFFSHGTDSNSTYSAMTQAEITAGTGTTGRTITPKMLRDNFYTESEVDALLPVDFDGRQHGLVPMPRASETVMVLGSDGNWKTVTAAQTVQISYNLKYCEASSHLNEYIDETLWGNFADPTVATSVFIDDINVSLT